MYKLMLLLITLVFIFTVSGNNPPRFVVPLHDGIKVYSSSSGLRNPQELMKVNRKNVLKVLAETDEMFKVALHSKERSGWIEKKSVAVTFTKKEYSFDDLMVSGYVELIPPDFLIDAAEVTREFIPIARTFHDELRDNCDKETLERCSQISRVTH